MQVRRILYTFFLFCGYLCASLSVSGCTKLQKSTKDLNKDPLMAQIRTSRELTIATDPTIYPLNLEGLDNQEGFEVDLAEFISQTLSKKINSPIKVKWIVVNFDTIKEMVKTGNAHLGINGLFATEDGKEEDWGIYSQAYYKTALTIAHKKNLGKHTLAKVKDSKKHVAIFSDPAAIEAMKKNDLKYLSFNVAEGHTAALLEDKVQFAAYDYPLLVEFINTNKDFILMEGLIPGTEANYSVLARKEASELMEIVNSSIKEYLKDDEIKKKYANYLIPNTKAE